MKTITLIIAFLFISFALHAQRPNILVIVYDDARYDSFQANDSTSFFDSPAIDRIAAEGVVFQYAFPALSLCSPSRASIMTGKYPHHHGVIENKKVKNEDFPHIVVSKILHDNGYYTGFVGKYGYKVIHADDGFDYVLESTSDLYWNSKYYYNSVGQNVITGHKTDVITEKALEFLNSVPANQPFLLFIEHKAAHAPYEPRPQDSGIFDSSPIPYSDNMQPWVSDIPSQYVDCYSVDTNEVKSFFKGYYELLQGAEESIDTILKFLEDSGMLDSTLIIFTSDNGFLFGEHLMEDKEVALEESIRIPMFIRYPEWFAPGTVVTTDMAMNIDIAPTILDAAGIPDTFNMDGMSMRTLDRKELFYEYFQRACKPTLVAVRDFNYKFVSSRCANTVEEFYDLVNDPEENTNLINDSASQSLIAIYRNKLDSLKTVYGYILVNDTIVDCGYLNASCSEECDISGTAKVTDINNSCDDGKIKVTFSGNYNTFITLELFNDDDSLIASDNTTTGASNFTFTGLTPGTYSIHVTDKCCAYDLIEISVKCQKPGGLSESNVTTTTATLNWNSQDCSDGYKLQYRVSDEDSAWIVKTPVSNTENITGLSPATIYEWRVATECDPSNPVTYSKYSSIHYFSTQ